LLLKAIAKSGIAQDARSVLDLGCGIGIIGIAIGAASPSSEIHFRDRDALAAAFTAHNARTNGITPASCGIGLTLTGLSGQRFDFIASNVPAKAGPPVIADFIQMLPVALSESGRFALLVVNPIAQAVRKALIDSGAPLGFQETGPGHTFFAGKRGTETPAAPDEFQIYERCRSSFALEETSYALSGYWGLPEFDTPSYATVLAAGLCERAWAGSLFRSVSISNPGPGHLTLFVCTRFQPSQLSLLSRDSLQTIATSRNLAASGFFPVLSVSDGLDPRSVGQAYADLIVEIPEPVPEYDWIAPIWERASRQAKTGTSLVFVSRPTEAVRFDKRKSAGWTRRFDRKRDGFLGLVYRKDS